MYTYVNVINACCFSQILFEVLHMRNKKLLLACEVLINFAVFVEHVNHDDLLLLLTAPCLLEAVMYSALAADRIRPTDTTTTQIIRGALAHAATSLLFL